MKERISRPLGGKNPMHLEAAMFLNSLEFSNSSNHNRWGNSAKICGGSTQVKQSDHNRAGPKNIQVYVCKLKKKNKTNTIFS